MLTQAASADFTDPASHLEALKTALAGAKNMVKPRPVLDALVQACMRVVEDLANTVVSTDVPSLPTLMDMDEAQPQEAEVTAPVKPALARTAAIDLHRAVIKLLKDETPFCDIVGGKSKFQKRTDTLLKAATATLQLEVDFSALQAADGNPSASYDLLKKMITAAIAAVEARPLPLPDSTEDFSLEEDPVMMGWHSAVGKIVHQADLLIHGHTTLLSHAGSKLRSMGIDNME